MAYTRAADDFPAIRARVEELRRERERVDDTETNVRSVQLGLRRPDRIFYWPAAKRGPLIGG